MGRASTGKQRTLKKDKWAFRETNVSLAIFGNVPSPNVSGGFSLGNEVS